MNRRGFLRGALGAAVGIVAGAELVEALAPKRTIFLPPRGGWFPNVRVLRSEAEVLELFGPDVTTIHTAIGHELDALLRVGQPIYYNDEGLKLIEARVHAVLRKFGETDAELRERAMQSLKFNWTVEL